jgi:hypothetical protein
VKRIAVVGSALALFLTSLALAAPTPPHEHPVELWPHLDMEPPDPDIPTGVTSARYRARHQGDLGGPVVAYRPHARPKPATGVIRSYRTGFEAGEPSLGLDDKGTIFYQGIQPVVIRSTDGGTKWKDVSPMLGNRRRHPTTLDPYLWLDPATGRVFTFDFYFGCSELSWTDDGGTTWSTSVLQCGEQDHQTLFGGPPAISPTLTYPNVVYACSTQGGATIYSVAAQCSKSLDGGLTWVFTGAPAYVTDVQDENDLGVAGVCHGAVGHGFVGPDGTVYLPKGLCGQPWLAISHDEGATWTRVQISELGMPQTTIGVYEHEAAVAADKKGNVYYFWIANDRMPYLAVSNDGGETWSRPNMVAPRGLRETSLPTMEIGADGRVAMTYMGSTNSPGEPFPESNDCKPDPVYCFTELFFLGPEDPKRYADVTWNGYMTVTTDPLAKDPVFTSATVNDPKDPLVRGTCGPIRCKAVYDFLDIVVDKHGTAWAAFVDICITACAEGGTANQGNEGVVGKLVVGPR